MKISRSKMISIITISLIVIITFVYVFYLINKTNKLNTMYAYQNNNINSNIEQEEINEETTSLEVQEPEIVTVYGPIKASPFKSCNATFALSIVIFGTDVYGSVSAIATNL